MDTPLDYATPAQGRRRLRGRALLALLAISTLLVFVLSSAVWTREFASWTSRGEFEIDAVRTEWGVPHWLVYTTTSSTGTPPPMNSGMLPFADEFQPGWRIRLGTLCISLAGSAMVGLSVCTVAWFFRAARGAPERWSVIVPILSGAVLLAGGAGWISDRTDFPVDFLLPFVGVPIIVCAGAFYARSYVGSMVVSVGAVAAYWWASRMEDLRGAGGGGISFEDLRSVVIISAIAALAGFGITFMREKPRPGTSTPTATDRP